jgi:hypothetical protein
MLFYREGQRFPKLGEIFSESYDTMFVIPMEKYFAFAKSKGNYKNVTSEKLARLFCDLVLSALNNRLIICHDLPDASEINRHIDAIVQVFTKGMH